MRRLRPSRELLLYLDHELEGRAVPAGVVVPSPSASPPKRRARARAALAGVAVALVVLGAGVASIAFAQDVGVASTTAANRDGNRSRRRTRSEEAARASNTLDEEVVASPSADAGVLASDSEVDQPDGGVAPPTVEPVRGETLGGADGSPAEVAHPATAIVPSTRAAVDRALWPRPPLSFGLAGAVALIGALGFVLRRRRSHGKRAGRERQLRMARLAIESRRGGRPYNEDRSCAFTVGRFDVLVCADGMGGHIGGARAASIVVEAARRYLQRTLPIASDPRLVSDFVRCSFARAAESLAAEDAELGLGAHGQDALRSTLIVAVVEPDRYVVGAQGDGGAWVIRSSGRVRELMVPAKGGASNIVTASLGPVTEGTVDIRAAKRKPGDLLVVCSDGVADRIVRDAFNNALRTYVDEATSASEAVRSVLDELERRPEIFDDNLTAGILVTP